MVSVVIVMADEAVNRRLQVFLHEVVFEQDTVLQAQMPTLVIGSPPITSLRLGMVWGPAHMSHPRVG